jgi:DNA-nicking Smr family endonuclease
VLVITGKGRNAGFTKEFSKNEGGVLKKSLPLWLKSYNVKRLILDITVAHASHGGDGAFYVYLRKQKPHRT